MYILFAQTMESAFGRQVRKYVLKISSVLNFVTLQCHGKTTIYQLFERINIKADTQYSNCLRQTVHNYLYVGIFD